MEKETLELLINSFAGPASGIVVSMVCLFAFGWFLIKHLLPSHEKQLNNVLEESKETRKTFEKAVTGMTKRLDKIEDDITIIKEKI